MPGDLGISASTYKIPFSTSVLVNCDRQKEIDVQGSNGSGRKRS